MAPPSAAPRAETMLTATKLNQSPICEITSASQSAR
jgi:hypothetical protein